MPTVARAQGDGVAYATRAGEAANPRFFGGFLSAPAAAATALLAVADAAAARYYRPSTGAWLDPAVAGDGDRLRFESFSGCCRLYARLDVLAPGLDGDDVGHGTTNVDINPPLRWALAGLGGLDPLHLAVGPEEVAVRTFDGEFVEKKVPLLERWLRGSPRPQVLAAGFALRAEVPAAEAAARRDSRCTWPWRPPSDTSSANATWRWTRCWCSPRGNSSTPPVRMATGGAAARYAHRGEPGDRRPAYGGRDRRVRHHLVRTRSRPAPPPARPRGPGHRATARPRRRLRLTAARRRGRYPRSRWLPRVPDRARW
ncbi:hypothetical protein ACFV2X_19870 [Streptomyces sp. NPDC059679]|uniref:hypothetical protein n=1 Tax=Streptomyces sp. NPDC059679 TaxID=3346903 RepID=UPI0036B598D3